LFITEFRVAGCSTKQNTSYKRGVFEKSKTQLITGIVLLGAGTVVTGIGVNQMITYTGNDIGNAFGGLFGVEPTKLGSNGVALTVVGFATVVTSGVMLLAANRNKKAARLVVNMEMKQSGLVYSTGVRNVNYPAVSVRLRLQ
jgi:hypothetical protein